MRGRSACLAVVVALLPACSSGSEAPSVSNARIGQPAGAHGALYMTVSSDGTADRLIDARTDAASTVEFHESVLASDGTASMRRLAAMVLPSGGSLVLEPGGLHLMLLDVDRLDIGEMVEVTLVWEHAGEMVIVATVVDPAEALEGHQES